MSTLKEFREAKGLSGAQLAELAETSQPQIWRLETGKRPMTKKWAERLAPHLGRTPQELLFGHGIEAAIESNDPGKEGYLTKDDDENWLFVDKNNKKNFVGADIAKISVHPSYNASGRSIIVARDKVDSVTRPWFLRRSKSSGAIIVSGTTMEPAYYAGDLAIINRLAALVRGKDVFILRDHSEDEFEAILCQYAGETATEWIAQQLKPPEGEGTEFRLPKEDWPIVMRVVGRYDGG